MSKVLWFELAVEKIKCMRERGKKLSELEDLWLSTRIPGHRTSSLAALRVNLPLEKSKTYSYICPPFRRRFPQPNTSQHKQVLNVSAVNRDCGIGKTKIQSKEREFFKDGKLS